MLKAILFIILLSSVGFYGGWDAHRISSRHQPVSMMLVGSCGNYVGAVFVDADGTQHPYTAEKLPVEAAQAMAQKFGDNATIINTCPASKEDTGITARNQ